MKLADNAVRAFEKRFGTRPTAAAVAPGRVEIMGNHTDYNGGFVLPAALDVPGGTVAVDYTAPVPVAAARAHLFYGSDLAPQLAKGRIPMQIALLSPAGRPIAVTADLAGFWRGGWKEARRDMRGRYPKHDWPEEPWKEAATRK